MKFILATKKGMTQIFDETGTVFPVTVVEAGPCPVVRIKEKTGKDGYSAAVVGLPGSKRLGKRDLGQTRGLGQLAFLKEFIFDEKDSLAVGDYITVGSFSLGDRVKVTGVSKGKGFQGVVKRHGFHGHPKSHGHKDQLRTSGSVSPGGVQRVFPGIRMAGQMGNERVTVKNLKVVRINIENNEIYLQGAVPGAKGGLLMISCQGELKSQKKPSVDASDKPVNQEQIQPVHSVPEQSEAVKQ